MESKAESSSFHYCFWLIIPSVVQELLRVPAFCVWCMGIRLCMHTQRIEGIRGPLSNLYVVEIMSQEFLMLP